MSHSVRVNVCWISEIQDYVTLCPHSSSSHKTHPDITTSLLHSSTTLVETSPTQLISRFLLLIFPCTSFIQTWLYLLSHLLLRLWMVWYWICRYWRQQPPLEYADAILSTCHVQTRKIYLFDFLHKSMYKKRRHIEERNENFSNQIKEEK